MANYSDPDRGTGGRTAFFTGAPAALRVAGRGQLPEGAELPAVFLRPAGFGGRHLDADRGPVVSGAATHWQRDGPRAGDSGPLSAYVRLRPDRRVGRRSDEQAPRALRDADAGRAVGRHLRGVDRNRCHRHVDGLPSGPGSRRRQHLRQPDPAELHRRDGPPSGSVQCGDVELRVTQCGSGVRRRAGRSVRRRAWTGRLLRPERGVVWGGAGLAGHDAQCRSLSVAPGGKGKGAGPGRVSVCAQTPRS